VSFMVKRLLALLVVQYLIAFPGETVMAARQTHPHLYLTCQDVERAKLNIARSEWARETFQKIIAEADKWASMSEDSLREMLPPPGAEFAYGFSGCPECGAGWPWWGGRGPCSLDRPRTTKCPSCGRVFPDEKHPDSGDGWLDKKTGKRYWFVATYNSYVIQLLTLSALDSPVGEQFGLSALDALSNAYALTGDEKYARTAAVIFDALAAIYPTCTVGSIDYPNAPGGRLERTQYQVARVIVLLARYYDLIYNSPALSVPSQAGEPTIRASIEERILKDAARYCYEQGSTGRYGLTNGEADFVRGVLAVGLLLDMRSYIDWALSGPYSVFNFLENNLLRDGQYYETSVGYSQHALNLYVDMAEMLACYRSAEYPDGIDLYSHPKLSKALVQGELDVVCAGHLPRFGDWGPDWKKLGAGSAYNPLLHIRAEQLYHRARSPEARAYWADILSRACEGKAEERRANAPRTCKVWLLYHAEPIPDSAATTPLEPTQSALLDGKGLAILRSGSGPSGRAALIRYGPSVCHGHLDDLNLNFFALGRELTYDLGYSLGSAHVQTGWAKQTASHNLVVVNETSQMRAGPTGGSVHLFADGDPITLTELSSEASYQSEGVSVYRRTAALIDSGPESSYLVDVFRVAGGRTHDLVWHAYGEKLEIAGAELGEVRAVGSLAGGKKTILVPDASQFKKGQGLITYDLQTGDAFEIPTNVTINRRGRMLQITATAAGTIDLEGRRYDFGRGTSSIAL